MKTRSMRAVCGLAAHAAVPLVVCTMFMSPSALGQDATSGKQAAEPAPPPDPWKRQVFFGEQHLHTQDSLDAFAMGTRNTQEDAYNFAKGKAIKKSTTGKMVQKKTPYDWVAVTDHAWLLGMLPMVLDDSSPLSKTEIGKLIASGDPKKGDQAFAKMMAAAQAGVDPAGFTDLSIQRSAWDRQKATANKFNDPGTFTTLIAFEWTSIPYGQNLHRNVFFRDDEGPAVPFTNLDSDRAEHLWTYQRVQRDMGHENFSIPHNGNVSNSKMYAPFTSYGTPITKIWAQRRAANEVATEILQTKGQSDTHPALSPHDEFAEFETGFKHMLGTGGVVSKIDYSYVRQALINGVGFQEYFGANPFKFGIVAGADAHTGFSDNEEFNYTGVHGTNDDTPERRLSGAGQTAGEAAIMFGTPGATGVWADENTRPAIFDGIKRKESFGTSGPLIRVRFFGGWDYPKDLTTDKDYVKKAYQGGVPMGGDLPPRIGTELAKAPSFAVSAMKDPDSGNLDRIQIIKGWFKNGYAWENIYDVALSDGRVADPKTGKVPPVGNTVNAAKASYTNSIGDSQLSAVWTDPDFNPELHAVYYVRVLEIPTPRWSTYDAVNLGVPIPDGTPVSLQERAWSSPIWYTPDPSLVKKQGWYPGLNIQLEK